MTATILPQTLAVARSSEDSFPQPAFSNAESRATTTAQDRYANSDSAEALSAAIWVGLAVMV